MSNPGVNGQTLASINTPEFRQHLIDNALTPNLHAATSGNFSNPYVTAAAFYGGYQYLHDTCYWCIAAAASGDATLIDGGKGALSNFGTVQDGTTGFIPIGFNETTELVSGVITQPPVIATAALALHRVAPDLTWLASVYEIAKKHHQFWTTYRSDPVTRLIAYGTTNTAVQGDTPDGTPGLLVQAGEEGQDAIGWLYKNWEYSSLVDAAPGDQTRMRHSLPCISSWIAGSARDLAAIATLIGETADASDFEAEHDAWKARINKWLWDATAGNAGRYAMFQDSTDWHDAGLTTDADVAIDDTSISLIVPAGEGLTIVPGAVIIVSGDLSDESSLVRYQCSSATSISAYDGLIAIPILPATEASTAGTAARIGRFSQIQTLPFHAIPLWAGIPDSTRAPLVAAELTQDLDGTVEDGMRYDFSPWIGNPASNGFGGASGEAERFSLAGIQNQHAKPIGPGLTEWTVVWEGVSGTNDAVFVDDVSLASFVLNLGYLTFFRRWADTPLGDKEKTIYDPSWEQVSATRPLRITITYKQAPSIQPTVSAHDMDGNTLFLDEPVGSMGTDEDTVTYTFAPDTPCIINDVSIGKTSGGDGLAIKSVQITEQPSGFSYRTPYGLVSQPRLARHSYARLYTDSRDYVTNTTTGHGEGSDDYWKGDHPPYIIWHAVKGLLANGQTAAANDIALRYAAAASNEYKAFLDDSSVGAAREWLSMNGAMNGATQYGWAGLPLDLMSPPPPLAGTSRRARIPLGVIA